MTTSTPQDDDNAAPQRDSAIPIHAAEPFLRRRSGSYRVLQTEGYHTWSPNMGLRQWLLLAPVLLLAMWGMVGLSGRLSRWTGNALVRNDATCWCGNSNQEAITMGCIYDHIAVDWLPPSCVDNELVNEFDASGPGVDGTWPYYELNSAYRYAPINASDIDLYAIEGKDYYATPEWHVAHCLFIWRKEFRASSEAKTIEPWNNKEAHIVHCSDYILRAIRSNVGLDDVDTYIPGRDRHIEE
ncbi:hypothetical protein LTR37_017841 [Vermiconidia calcicola]|uniref:Uncharacterized protein n=1 Tax=Vermiconidia calcicola TaxID=1690605 RepID=A0ACC3MIX5_9PEZI|nr:hypothetical protein LTR37_017841 [Vermiconidia calcicola]